MKKRNLANDFKAGFNGPKPNKNRHPAGGYYWKPDWPGGKTPKKYSPPKPPIRNA